MDLQLCLICLEHVGNDALSITPETEMFYQEVCFKPLIKSVTTEEKICQSCSAKIEIATELRRVIRMNRIKLEDYLINRDLKAREAWKAQETLEEILPEDQIKVEQEDFFPEDYQVTFQIIEFPDVIPEPETIEPKSEQDETSNSTVSVSNDDNENACSFCNSSAEPGLDRIHTFNNCFTCPECGRICPKIQSYICHFCPSQRINTIKSFRLHFESKKHFAKFQCPMCQLFFFTALALRIHGQNHCNKCQVMFKKQGYGPKEKIPAEFHLKSCRGIKVKVLKRFDHSEKQLIEKLNKARNLKLESETSRKMKEKSNLVEGRSSDLATVEEVRESSGLRCSMCHNELNKQKPPVTGVFYSCCPKCGQTVPNIASYPVRCNICKKFETLKLSQMRLHIVMSHEIAMKMLFIRCPVCCLTFFNQYALKTHKNVCRSVRKVEERSENSTLSDPLQVSNSEQASEPKKVLVKRLFAFTKPSEDSNEVEMDPLENEQMEEDESMETSEPENENSEIFNQESSEETENDVICSLCDSQGVSNSSSDENTVTCPNCKQRVTLTEIIRMKLEKFKCSLCDFKTHSSGEIRNHIQVKHARSKVLFQCNICLDKVESEEKLKEHNQKNHSFVCTICGVTSKKFLRKETLEEHVKKHQRGKNDKEKPFDQNPLKFSNAQNLLKN